MINEINKVKEWQRLFGRMGHEVSETPILKSTNLANYRAGFIAEETMEYLDANNSGDLVGVLDALCDLQYFLFGMVVIHGLQNVFEEAFDIVHQSNMSKLDNGQPKFRESDGKVLKGPDYWKPEAKLEELLKKYQENK